MYHLASTNAWYDGMKFNSLAEAVAKQRKAIESGAVNTDVMRHEDNHSTKVVLVGHNATDHANRLSR